MSDSAANFEQSLPRSPQNQGAEPVTPNAPAPTPGKRLDIHKIVVRVDCPLHTAQSHHKRARERLFSWGRKRFRHERDAQHIFASFGLA